MTSSKLIFTVLCVSCLVSCYKAPEVKEEPKQPPRTRQEIVLSYAPVVKKVAPAVVNIYAIHHAKGGYPSSPFMEDPFFKQFFDHLHPDENRDQNSLGSGLIVNSDGLILTNYHVIENADVIRVVLSDKREYVAKLTVTDKKTDLALLEIEGGSDFPFLSVSPQEDLEVGDIVLAIGNPFGVGQTVTSGIVSALARSQEGISDYRSFIQTDAAINPGNSGGALVTTDGRLVGVNTAIYSKTGGSMGIGFAIPINLAIPVIESIKNGGQIIRPWLGLSVVPVTNAISKELGLSRPYGVLVKGVYPGGPADKAGVKVGDYIIAIDEKEVEDDSSFVYQVAILPLGKKAEFTILRDGDEKKLPIILTEPMRSKDSSSFRIERSSPLFGASLKSLSPALAIDLGIDPMKRGVIVTSVDMKSSSAQLGIEPGDILESINKQKVTTPQEVVHVLESSNHRWTLVLHRKGRSLTIQVSG